MVFETDRPNFSPESAASVFAQQAPLLQVGQLPGIDRSVPAAFGPAPTVDLTELYPTGPVVPDPYHQGPQLGGHTSGHGPNIDDPNE
jgi:hypothetical protein